MTNDSNEDAELGTCDLCGQKMIRTADDCWHPWNVAKACPPEPSSVPFDAEGWAAFRAAGLAGHRPGREHFRTLPSPIEAHLTIPAEAFDALVEDLDAPARPSKLRDLM